MALDTFPVVTLVLHGLVVLLFALVTDYDDADRRTLPLDASKLGDHAYNLYSQVSLMILVGFGFLYAFLRRYRYAGISWTFWILTYIIPLSILMQGFWHKVHTNFDHKILLSIPILTEATVAAAVTLVSFGAWMGKVSPEQLYFMAFMETFFFALNFYLVIFELEIIDIGGTIAVHIFGAYFGLAASLNLSPEASDHAQQDKPSYSSDSFSLLGTMILWVLWPSFNGAFAPDATRYRVIINTVLALCGSGFVTFMASRLFRREKTFALEDLQNSTLAGGVAIGAAADLRTTPGGALLVGSLGGLLSVWGYVFLSPWLHKRGIRDTAGIHNLHGMPAVFGGLVSAFFAATPGTRAYSVDELAAVYKHDSPGKQAGMQVAGVVVTLVVSLASGALSGWLATHLPGFKHPGLWFKDDEYFEMPEQQDRAHLHGIESRMNMPTLPSKGSAAADSLQAQRQLERDMKRSQVELLEDEIELEEEPAGRQEDSKESDDSDLDD